ncbi:MAG: hypothetical protein IT323_08935 [Anaerolineae bacterium]|nr:hypothetical protein [Anaerolineae bacterium]
MQITKRRSGPHVTARDRRVAGETGDVQRGWRAGGRRSFMRRTAVRLKGQCKVLRV